MAKSKKSDNLLWRPYIGGKGDVTPYKMGYIFRDDKRNFSIKLGASKSIMPTKSLRDAKLLLDVYSASIWKKSKRSK